MDREFDEIKGLECGGDDYLRKPFSPRILIARINSIFRRLEKIKENKKISHLALIKQSRLSVMPIDYKSWKIICNMGKV